ncbi:hypothetical protein N7468_006642 [Penicillium chermesinum]|uniref:LysM domain-containing protein n=1 Tax=Penicillium chermesinum TaxID=63820 RepID=A0A9W9NSL6_9EURO|nr:uncharacterized protein N7468_006642 [Penicillium chermesinum]KAJ5225417.1 hypothetical protein N7468_006642 [Penicillium chermesinum]KAJ6161359.1 hypothetical protein N7470_004755 [Penicillium chermesinum]
MVDLCTWLLCTLGLGNFVFSAAIQKEEMSKNNETKWTGYGDTCWDIVNRNENTLTVGQLLCWNPDINPQCSNLIPGHIVCVGYYGAAPLCT